MALSDYNVVGDGSTCVAGLLHGEECKIALVLCIVTFLGAALRFFQQIKVRWLAVTVAGVLDEPYSQLIPLSGVALQARQITQAGTVSTVHPM